MPWNPEQYRKFKEERFLPFADLMSLVRIRAGMTVLDLGCGTGELTVRLVDQLPDSRVTGRDSSATMLEKARERAHPRVDFAPGSVEDAAGQWDLVFSHAVLHWVGDHPRLVPRLLALLRPGGQLAVQVPANHRAPSHTLIVETAREEPFCRALGGWVRHSPVLEIDDYASLLHQAGAEEITVLEKAYHHQLPDADAVAEWTAGTTLVPYFERLPEDLHEPFLERYRAKLRAVWPEQPLFFTFRRILLAATRPAALER